MSPVADPSMNWTARFPRLRGDEPLKRLDWPVELVFSPPTRG